MRLPSSRPPSIAVGLQPVHLPARTMRSPAPMRRAVASTSAIVMSAVSSVSTPGVLVTVMPRWRAVSRSMWSTPVPNEAISFSRGPAWLSTRLSMRSVTVGTSTSAVLTASTSSAAVIGLSSAFRRVSNSSISRVSIALGRVRVTITSGFFFETGGIPARIAISLVACPAEVRRPAPKAPLFQLVVVGSAEMRYKDGQCEFVRPLPSGRPVLC